MSPREKCGLALVLLSVAAVEWALVGVTGLAQGAAILALFDGKFFIDRGARRLFAVAGVAIMAILTLASVFRPPTVRLSQYKGLSYALNLPDAHVVAERSSPLGRVDVVASPAIREAPGLSLVAPTDAVPPRQLGLYMDAESAGAITAFDGDASKLNHLDWMITAAPYFALARCATGLAGVRAWCRWRRGRLASAAARRLASGRSRARPQRAAVVARGISCLCWRAL